MSVDIKIIVLAQGAWGKGWTVKSALRKMRAAVGSTAPQTKRYLVLACHPATYVSDLGVVTFPRGSNPQIIDRVGYGREKPRGLRMVTAQFDGSPESTLEQSGRIQEKK